MASNHLAEIATVRKRRKKVLENTRKVALWAVAAVRRLQGGRIEVFAIPLF
jgi:hypothetical protein